jgi:hypothetical protein
MQVPMAQWNQAGGNPAGSGFRAVNTVAPVRVPQYRLGTRLYAFAAETASRAGTDAHTSRV